MTDVDYESDIKGILLSAGEAIMNLRTSFSKVEEKEKNEIVTQADIKSNQLITSELQIKYPEIPVFSEEENFKNQGLTRWILDPLDGTTRCVWGNSGVAISLALEKDGEIVVGAVYDPVMKEFFYAEKSRGATRNGTRIMSSNELDLEKMFLVVDWGNKDEKRIEGLTYFKHFFIPKMFARRIVPQWAPALGLCKIAEGRIHGLVCNDTWVEDHSAGALILKEAGGYVSNFYNIYSFNHREPGIIVTNNKETHFAIVNFLKKLRVIKI